MGLIRKLAARRYSKELNGMINGLSQAPPEWVAKALILGVWERATLEVEGNLDLPGIKNDDGELNPELNCYPIPIALRMLGEMMKWVSFFNKNNRPARSHALSIWVHTLRSIYRPELSNLAKKMWNILMTSEPHWERLLTQIRDEDIKLGVAREKVLSTEKHARAILQCLPPKQLVMLTSNQ